MTETHIVGFELLLLIAALVAMIAQRLRLPFTVGLVLAGVGVAFLPIPIQLTLTKELIFTAFLPPLIFEAALHMRWKPLRKDAPVILTFASVGVLLSAGLTAAGMHWLIGWSWASAALFGVLLSATDPVSVIATFKEFGVSGRLRVLMEGESLVNDSTAAVAFVTLLAVAMGGAVTPLGIAETLLLSVFGGIACGAAVAGALLLLAGKTTDPLIEITFTTIAAYGSFLLAEHFHLSGVLAVLTAGLMVGNLGSLGSISERGRVAVISFWDYAAFVVNSLIFILIGLSEAHQDFLKVLGASIAAVVLVTAGRAMAIYPLAALFARSTRLRVPMRKQHVLFWGGLRGALALALALGLPASLPHRDEMVTVAFAVVAFSIVVQGMTMQPLLRRLGHLDAKADDDDDDVDAAPHA